MGRLSPRSRSSWIPVCPILIAFLILLEGALEVGRVDPQEEAEDIIDLPLEIFPVEFYPPQAIQPLLREPGTLQEKVVSPFRDLATQTTHARHCGAGPESGRLACSIRCW